MDECSRLRNLRDPRKDRGLSFSSSTTRWPAAGEQIGGLVGAGKTNCGWMDGNWQLAANDKKGRELTAAQRASPLELLCQPPSVLSWKILFQHFPKHIPSRQIRNCRGLQVPPLLWLFHRLILSCRVQSSGLPCTGQNRWRQNQ